MGLIEDANRALTALTGRRSRVVRTWAEIVLALDAGHRDLVLEVPWQDPGEPARRHTVILKHRSLDRLVYFNPKGHGSLPPGFRLLANQTLPERRVEGMGLESMAEKAFQGLFETGEGKALIPL